MRKKEYQQACAELDCANQHVAWLNTRPAVDPLTYRNWIDYQQYCNNKVAAAAQAPSGLQSLGSVLWILIKVCFSIVTLGFGLILISALCYRGNPEDWYW